jgi:hypothetical protein
MFLRFLKLLLKIFLMFTFLTFAVIMPADAVGVDSEAKGLDLVTWTKCGIPSSQHDSSIDNL